MSGFSAASHTDAMGPASVVETVRGLDVGGSMQRRMMQGVREGLCEGCRLPPPTTKGWTSCGQCGMAKYCGKACQRAAWAQHRHACGMLAEVRKRSEGRLPGEPVPAGEDVAPPGVGERDGGEAIPAGVEEPREGEMPKDWYTGRNWFVHKQLEVFLAEHSSIEGRPCSMERFYANLERTRRGSWWVHAGFPKGVRPRPVRDETGGIPEDVKANFLVHCGLLASQDPAEEDPPLGDLGTLGAAASLPGDAAADMPVMTPGLFCLVYCNFATAPC